MCHLLLTVSLVVILFTPIECVSQSVSRPVCLSACLPVSESHQSPIPHVAFPFCIFFRGNQQEVTFIWNVDEEGNSFALIRVKYKCCILRIVLYCFGRSSIHLPFFPGSLLSLWILWILFVSLVKKGPVFGECDPDCFLLLMSICILYSFMKGPTMLLLLSIPLASVSMSLFYITKSRLTLSCAACLCTYVFFFLSCTHLLSRPLLSFIKIVGFCGILFCHTTFFHVMLRSYKIICGQRQLK